MVVVSGRDELMISLFDNLIDLEMGSIRFVAYFSYSSLFSFSPSHFYRFITHCDDFVSQEGVELGTHKLRAVNLI